MIDMFIKRLSVFVEILTTDNAGQFREPSAYSKIIISYFSCHIRYAVVRMPKVTEFASFKTIYRSYLPKHTNHIVYVIRGKGKPPLVMHHVTWRRHSKETYLFVKKALDLVGVNRK